MMALCVDAGVGRHIWTVGYKGIEAFLKVFFRSASGLGWGVGFVLLR